MKKAQKIYTEKDFLGVEYCPRCGHKLFCRNCLNCFSQLINYKMIENLDLKLIQTKMYEKR